MTLIWRSDSTSESEFTFAELTNYLDLCDEGMKVDVCVPFPKGMQIPVVASEAKGDPTDYFMAGFAFIVSQKRRTILEDMAVVAEYFQVELTHNGEAFSGSEFFMVNLLDSVECLDYEKSKYTCTPTGITEIEDLVIDNSQAIGHHLFMLGPIGWAHSPNSKAVREVICCASEELATRCITQGITGVAFTLPNDRNVYPPPHWAPNA